MLPESCVPLLTARLPLLLIVDGALVCFFPDLTEAVFLANIEDVSLKSLGPQLIDLLLDSSAFNRVQKHRKVREESWRDSSSRKGFYSTMLQIPLGA